MFIARLFTKNYCADPTVKLYTVREAGFAGVVRGSPATVNFSKARFRKYSLMPPNVTLDDDTTYSELDA